MCKNDELKKNEGAIPVSDEELENVSSGANPFSDVTRVDVNPIDESLREKI